MQEVPTYIYKMFYFIFSWSYCKGLCGETGYMSRQRNRSTSSSVFCEFNNEWKTCHIVGCTKDNYTKNVEGNELRIQELNYIERFRNTNSIILDKCISDYCDYDTVKKVLTNNYVG